MNLPLQFFHIGSRLVQESQSNSCRSHRERDRSGGAIGGHAINGRSGLECRGFHRRNDADHVQWSDH